MIRGVDAHQHFWRPARGDYGWLTPALTALYRDFGPADLEPLLSANGVSHTVLVQAAPTVAETRYLLGLADTQEFIAGVVGWVDMESQDVEESLAGFALHAKLVGIRPMLQDLEDTAWIARRGLAVAAEALTRNGLSFDALVKAEHLQHLLTFIERHPDLRIVIDHGAKPAIRDRAWQPWADRMAAVAEHTAVYCKLSGLITEAGAGQSYDALFRYLDHLLESFGPTRLMWGSDWPVLNLAGDYSGWHQAILRWLEPLDAAERERILGGNAVRFYELDIPETRTA